MGKEVEQVPGGWSVLIGTVGDASKYWSPDFNKAFTSLGIPLESEDVGDDTAVAALGIKGCKMSEEGMAECKSVQYRLSQKYAFLDIRTSCKPPSSLDPDREKKEKLKSSENSKEIRDKAAEKTNKGYTLTGIKLERQSKEQGIKGRSQTEAKKERDHKQERARKEFQAKLKETAAKECPKKEKAEKDKVAEAGEKAEAGAKAKGKEAKAKEAKAKAAAAKLTPAPTFNCASLEKDIDKMRDELPDKMKEINEKHLIIDKTRAAQFKEQVGKQDERNAKLDAAGLKHSSEEVGHDEARIKMKKEKKEKDDRAAAHKADL